MQNLQTQAITTLEIKFDNTFLDVFIQIEYEGYPLRSTQKETYQYFVALFIMDHKWQDIFDVFLETSVWPNSNFHIAHIKKKVSVEETIFAETVSLFMRSIRSVVHFQTPTGVSA